MVEYVLSEKRDFSPHFDLHFIVKIDEENEKEFSFPLYNDTRPFTEEEYMSDVKAEIEHEIDIILNPPPEIVPEPIEI